MIADVIEIYRGSTLRQRIFAFVLVTVFFALPGPAQPRHQGTTPQQDTPAGPPPPQTQREGKPQQGSAPYNPFPAEKDVEVGTFYMRKGDLDAAIPRFEEAARLRPDWGKPLFLLGDVYERKHDPASAVKYYKEYLRVYPHAPDAKKIRQKIGKLSQK
jgi:tetratricopeptide (TPR) repeat protein